MSKRGILEPHEEMANLIKTEDERESSPPHVLVDENSNAYESLKPAMVRFEDFAKLMQEKDSLARQLDAALDKVEELQFVEDENAVLKSSVQEMEKDMDQLCEQIEKLEAEKAHPPIPVPRKKQLKKQESVPIFVNVQDEDSDDEGEQMIIDSTLPGANVTEEEPMLREELNTSRELVNMLKQRLQEMEERHETEVEEATEEAKKTINRLHALVKNLSETNNELVTAAQLHEQERLLMEEQIATLQDRLKEEEANNKSVSSAAAKRPPPISVLSPPSSSPPSSRPTSSQSKKRLNKKNYSGTSLSPSSALMLNHFSFDTADLESSEKSKQIIDQLMDENAWLTQCLTLVRHQHRDDQILLPKRKGGGPALATKQRAIEKEILRNMDKVIEYLQEQGVPPESPISRQFAVMYQRCMEAEDDGKEKNEHLIESLGELDTIRDLLGKKEGTALSAVKELVGDMQALQANFDAKVDELDTTKKNLDEQLNQLDAQIEEQGREYQNAISASAASIKQLQSELEQSAEVNDELTQEIQEIVAGLENAATLTDDSQLKSKLQGTIAHMRSAATGGGTARSHRHAGSSKHSMLPSNIIISRPPSQAPEIVRLDKSIGRSGSIASQMGEQAQQAISDLRKHMIDQEKRHQQEVQELVAQSEQLQQRQITRLKELEQLANLSEEDLQNEVLSLEVKVEELSQDRDALQANLEVSEENVARLQGAAEDHHQKALQIEESFEVELSALQDTMRKNTAAHNRELERLRALLTQSDDEKDKHLETMEAQLRREESSNRKKDEELAKVLAEMKRQRENQTRQFHEIERHHEEEVTNMMHRHEGQMAKMDHTIKDLQDDLRITTSQLSSSQQKVTSLSGQLEKLQSDSDDLVMQHDQELIQLKNAHANALEDSADLLQDVKLRNQDAVAQLEQQIAQLQNEVQHGQDQAQSLSSALSMKESELESARDGFSEERTTFDATAAQMNAHIHELEGDLLASKNARADQVAELNAVIREKDLNINALEQEVETLSAQVHGLQHTLDATTQQFEGELTKMSQLADSDKERDRQHAQNMATNYKKRIEQLAAERDALKAELHRLNSQFKQERGNLVKTSDAITADLAAAKVKHDNEISKLHEELNNNEDEKRQLSQDLRILKNAVAQHCREIQRTAPTADEGLDISNPQHMLRAALNAFLDSDQERATLRNRADALANELEASKQVASDLKLKLDGKKSELKQREGEARANNNAASALETRLATATDRCTDLERENTDLKSRMASLQEELRDQAASSASNQAHMNSILDSVRSGFSNEKSSFHQQVEGLRSDLHSAQDRIGEMRMQLRDQEEQSELLKSQVQAVEAERDGLQQSVAILKQKLSSSEKEIHNLGEELAKQSSDTAESAAAVRRCQSELENTTAFANTLQEDLEKIRDERESLMQENLLMKQNHENLQMQLADFDVVKQQHKNYAYEIDSLKRTMNEQRQELDKTHQDYLSTKSQAGREKRNQAAVIADLERQIQVAKTRQTKEKSALLKLEAQVKDLIEDKAQLERENSRQRGLLTKLKGQTENQAVTIKEKERQFSTLKKKNATLEEDVSMLQTQKRTMESRLRRDQSRRVADLSRTMDRSTLYRSAADSFILNNNNNTSLASMDASVRSISAGLRSEKAKEGRPNPNNTVLTSTLTRDE